MPFFWLYGDQVDHELSVPAVRVMLLACVCYTVVMGCQLMLDDKLSSSTKLALRCSALFGTIIFYYVVSPSHSPASYVTDFHVLGSV